MRSVRHYFFLGCYLGVFAAIVVLARALPELPGKLRGVPFDILDYAIGISGTLLVLAGIVLFSGVIGGFVGWLKLHTEKRTRAREEALIVRR